MMTHDMLLELTAFRAGTETREGQLCFVHKVTCV